MKIVLILISFCFLGCAGVQRNNERQIASYEIFQSSPFPQRLQSIQWALNKLMEIIPDKGHPRKNLLQKFKLDYESLLTQLTADADFSKDSNLGWMPSPQLKNFNQKIQILGKMSQSFRVMDQLGIYLTASKVMEEDQPIESYYYGLLAKSFYEIQADLSRLYLVYTVESQEKDRRDSQMSYAADLSSKARLQLHKVFDRRKQPAFKVIDQTLKKVEKVNTLSEAKDILKTPSWRRIRNELAEAELLNASDIDGIREEIDVKLATQFGFEMINYLYESLR